MTTFSRRQFAFGTAAAAATSMFPRLGIGAASAANVSGYKAFVCLFLRGGMDGHDFLLPVDEPSYTQYADIRRPLMETYSRLSVGERRLRTDLLELSPVNAQRFGTRAFGLPPEMPELHSLFENGKASIIANVGPLLEPTSRQQFEDRSAQRPTALFSHNDQRSTWMSLGPEGTRFGWGGKFVEPALAVNANQFPQLTAFSTSSSNVFLAAPTVKQTQVTDETSIIVEQYENPGILRTARQSSVAIDLLREQLRGGVVQRGNLFERDIMDVATRSIDLNRQLNEARAITPPLLTPFPETRLGERLQSVARTIAARDAVGAQRQVFYAEQGSYDTHATQPQKITNLQKELSGAVGAFYDAMVELGLENDVLLFTASDFGRALLPNENGTDHGWGGHHFVVGGSINGQRILGDVPPYELGHDLDAGNGRMIPAFSIEQYAAPMGQWFGLNDTELNQIFPNLNRFDGVVNIV